MPFSRPGAAAGSYHSSFSNSPIAGLLYVRGEVGGPLFCQISVLGSHAHCLQVDEACVYYPPSLLGAVTSFCARWIFTRH